MNTPTSEESWTSGRQAFVIVGRQRGGTLIHYTDDPMYEPDPPEVATSKVTALCGQYTRNAVLADEFDFTDPSLRVCPKCQRVNR
jgi:hypothetical protein